MARYDGLWNLLKETGHCAITAPPKLHRRIIRGVIKAKDEDNGYKLEQTLRYKRSKLSCKCEGSRVRFFLTHRVRLDMVSEESIGSSVVEITIPAIDTALTTALARLKALKITN